jgi:xylitol oxidase
VTGAPEELRTDLFGARAATAEQHPILGMDPVNSTAQLGAPGRWSDRLAHFRMGFAPSAGDEIQSEYFVPRRRAIAAIEALRSLADAIRPILQVCEIRTIAADKLWMSPQYGQDTVGIHFTWKRDEDGVKRVLADVEAVLAPFAPRPHWGKVFLADATALARLYERLPDFARLVERLDPRGAFRNEWLESHILIRRR